MARRQSAKNPAPAHVHGGGTLQRSSTCFQTWVVFSPADWEDTFPCAYFFPSSDLPEGRRVLGSLLSTRDSRCESQPCSLGSFAVQYCLSANDLGLLCLWVILSVCLFPSAQGPFWLPASSDASTVQPAGEAHSSSCEDRHVVRNRRKPLILVAVFIIVLSPRLWVDRPKASAQFCADVLISICRVSPPP